MFARLYNMINNNNNKKEVVMIQSKSNFQYDVFLINFGYTSASAKSFDEAIALAKKTGFQCSIINNSNKSVVGSFCPINGVFKNNKESA